MNSERSEKEWINCEKCGIPKHKDRSCACEQMISQEKEEGPTMEDVVGCSAPELGII